MKSPETLIEKLQTYEPHFEGYGEEYQKGFYGGLVTAVRIAEEHESRRETRGLDEDALLRDLSEVVVNGWEYGEHPRNKARILLDAIRPFLTDPERESQAHEWKTEPHVRTTPVKCFLCGDDAVAVIHAPDGCTCSPNKYQPRCMQHLIRLSDSDEGRFTIVEDFRIPRTKIEDGY